jgi:hypothetical protein
MHRLNVRGGFGWLPLSNARLALALPRDAERSSACLTLKPPPSCPGALQVAITRRCLILLLSALEGAEMTLGLCYNPSAVRQIKKRRIPDDQEN